MPLNAAPFSPEQVRTIRRWIAEGAPNTSPGQWHTWELKREPGWPRAVTVILTIAYAEKEPQGTGFDATYRKYVKQDRSLRSRLG